MFVKQNIHTKTLSPQCAIVSSRESQYPCIQFMKRHHPSICVFNYFLNSLLNDILYLLQITPEKKLATRKLDELLKQQKKKMKMKKKDGKRKSLATVLYRCFVWVFSLSHSVYSPNNRNQHFQCQFSRVFWQFYYFVY